VIPSQIETCRVSLVWRINVRPTHWRDWAKDSYKAGFKSMDAAPAQ